MSSAYSNNGVFRLYIFKKIIRRGLFFIGCSMGASTSHGVYATGSKSLSPKDIHSKDMK